MLMISDGRSCRDSLVHNSTRIDRLLKQYIVAFTVQCCYVCKLSTPSQQIKATAVLNSCAPCELPAYDLLWPSLPHFGLRECNLGRKQNLHFDAFWSANCSLEAISISSSATKGKSSPAEKPAWAGEFYTNLSTCTLMQLACLERCSDQWSPIRAMPMIPMRTANHATNLKWTEVPMQLSHLHGIRWSHQPRPTYPFIHLPSTYWAT